MKHFRVFHKDTKAILAKHNSWADDWTITKWPSFDASYQNYIITEPVADVDEDGEYIQPQSYGTQNSGYVYVPASDVLRSAIPENFNAIAVTGNVCDMSWTQVGGLTYYIFKDGTKIAEIVGSSYQDTALTTDQVYSYYIVGVNSYGCYGYPTQTVQVKAIS